MFVAHTSVSYLCSHLRLKDWCEWSAPPTISPGYTNNYSHPPCKLSDQEHKTVSRWPFTINERPEHSLAGYYPQTIDESRVWILWEFRNYSQSLKLENVNATLKLLRSRILTVFKIDKLSRAAMSKDFDF